jgi:hypothetical protein
MFERAYDNNHHTRRQAKSLPILLLPLLFSFSLPLTSFRYALARDRRRSAANARPTFDHRSRQSEMTLPVRTPFLEDVGHVIVS